MQPQQPASNRPILITIAGFVGLAVIVLAAFYAGTLIASTTASSSMYTQETAPIATSTTTPIASDQQAKTVQSDEYSDADADAQLTSCMNDPAKGGAGTQGINDCYTAALSAYQSDETSALSNLSQALQSINSNSDTSSTQYVSEAKNSFTAQEQSWKSYLNSLCTLSKDFATSGTIGPGWQMQCEIAAIRRHIQDMNDVARNALP